MDRVDHGLRRNLRVGFSLSDQLIRAEIVVSPVYGADALPSGRG